MFISTTYRFVFTVLQYTSLQSTVILVHKAYHLAPDAYRVGYSYSVAQWSLPKRLATMIEDMDAERPPSAGNPRSSLMHCAHNIVSGKR